MHIIIIRIINAWYNYYISNTDLLEECDKNENLGVNGLLIPPVQKEACKTFLFKVTYSPSRRKAGTPVINIQATLRTAPDLCKKNVSVAVLFGSKGNSYTISTQPDICVYIHMFFTL